MELTNGGLDSVLKVSHGDDTFDFASWSTPVQLSLTATNGTTYEHAADPVFLQTPNVYPYPAGRLYCFGTMYNGVPQNNPTSTAALRRR